MLGSAQYERNLAERFFSKFEHIRGIATRYDKHDKFAGNFLAGLHLASAYIFPTEDKLELVQFKLGHSFGTIGQKQT